MRRSAVVVVSVVGVLAGLLGVRSAAPAEAAASCPTRWGSLAETDARYRASPVVGVRAGRHACFYRLVVDLAGPVAGWDVAYVPRVVEDGSGRTLPLRGRAFLQVMVHAPAHDLAGRATYTPADPAALVATTGFTTFRQVAWAGTFEGRTTIGLGVRGRLPFRVLALAGPGGGSRLVVDVAHRW
jgi:hypothetical protein